MVYLVFPLAARQKRQVTLELSLKGPDQANPSCVSPHSILTLMALPGQRTWQQLAHKPQCVLQSEIVTGDCTQRAAAEKFMTVGGRWGELRFPCLQLKDGICHGGGESRAQSDSAAVVLSSRWKSKTNPGAISSQNL